MDRKPILAHAFISCFLTLKGIALALGLSLAVSAVFADDLTESQARLEQINASLQSLQAELKQFQVETDAQRRALAETETSIGRLTQSLNETRNRMAELNQALEQLAAESADLERRLLEKADDIAALLRLAYKQKNQPLIKLLLSGERPEELSRHLYYLSVLTREQQKQIEQWVAEQSRLAEVKDARERSLQQLEDQEQQLVAQQADLEQQKNRRAQVVANLQAQAEQTDDEIARMVSERERVTELITELEAQLASRDLNFAGAEPVEEARGSLPWPVDGRLMNRYGRAINQSGLTWQGWLLAADEGEPVRAVHGGRIIFADFFKSNGLLIIIDHGDGVWTLYGRNQALLRDVGSWVEPGDTIAQVGRSGGYNESGLYFEVRLDGEPQNPANWLQNR
ncbi:murein hydrolase activator EnvC family protein [Reinekea blandensis]|uniref:murein hydrolase activator EnvC family protein n=1 Tax=Reinekea blandensis TaxID=374838 RepID=UPI0013755F98|nr:peptidoglycan DD-metalloendopeptidase family protein [Reinekea blandensis]